MSTSSYNMHVTSAIKKIQERFKTLDITRVNQMTAPTPHFSNTYPEKVAVTDNIASNAGPDAIIDVQPDFRNIILYINHFVTRDYPLYDTKPHPALTPMSMTGYLLAIVYAHALISDDYNVRTKRSTYSTDFANTLGLDRILVLLKNMAVPPFMQTLLQSLSACSDERKANIRYAYSLACFDLKHDFGRSPPINLYFTAHNLIATKPTNIHPDDLLQEWLTTDIMILPTALKVHHYLGLRLDNYDYYNWFTQVHLSLFNPVTTRSNVLRPTFERMPLTPQVFNQLEENLNPYMHLLCLDPENTQNIENILTDLSQTAQDLYPSSIPLGKIEQDLKGQQIMNHYYQKILLPTHHKTAAGTGPYKTITASQSAEASHFRALPKFTPNVHPIQTTDDPTVHPTLYLHSNEAYNPAADPTTWSRFSIFTDVVGDIRHFCPFEAGSKEVYYNIVTGKLIECEEIESVSVPQPNPQNSLKRENSFFLESAVPLQRIVPSHFPEPPRKHLIERAHHNPAHPVVRVDLVNRASDRLPLFAPTLREEIPNALVGFHPTHHLQTTQLACNSICYTIGQGSNDTPVDKKNRPVYGWSSIRHLNTKQASSVNIRNRKLMLFNTRTIHGTNVTLVQTPHPTKCIPRT